jgi:predicted DNA binding CopG/RHH family protein
MKKKIKIPKFKNEDEERDFWLKLDLSKHFSPSDFERVSFPNLKPSSQPISLRLPLHLIARVKERANEIDIPYQSLMKKYIAQGILKEV